MLANNTITLVYDGSFDGLLSAIFYSYQQRLQFFSIQTVDNPNQDLLSNLEIIETNELYATRILNRVESVLGSQGVNMLLHAFLTEYEDRERLITQIIAKMVTHPYPKLLQNYADPSILKLRQWNQQIGREKHRMLAFVRFELMDNGVFFARTEPDFNVLHLISSHFEKRYADQKWLIYDVKRSYGIYYDLEQILPVTEIDASALESPEKFYSDKEKLFQTLWQTYFTHTNIKERKNLKLHKQWLPVRYWKYLTEKNSTF